MNTLVFSNSIINALNNNGINAIAHPNHKGGYMITTDANSSIMPDGRFEIIVNTKSARLEFCAYPATEERIAEVTEKLKEYKPRRWGKMGRLELLSVTAGELNKFSGAAGFLASAFKEVTDNVKL